MSDLKSNRLPALYIAHGGGPCFFMDWTMGPANTWDSMGEWLRGLGASLPVVPEAVVVVSAHWESPVVSIGSGAKPSLIYDYYGFPPDTYEITYDAPGSPDLANEICALLEGAGIASVEDPDRGYDHGVFIPLKLIYPEATIPVVQISLHQSLDPATHLDIGSALSPLRERDVLIIGSGMSYHNLTELMSDAGAIADSDKFDDWLNETCALEREMRAERLKNWHLAPAARSAHPREEHLLPLMVAAGAGSCAGARTIFNDRVMGSMVSGFQFN